LIHTEAESVLGDDISARITSGIAGKAGGNVTPSTGSNTGNNILGFGNEIACSNESETRNDRWPREATER
jgi:hypothetical protein